jgi:inhibitor of cysteine peptidase
MTTSGQAGPAGTVSFAGTVVYKDFEGGFYAIDADDGSAYDPVDLPREFTVDGLRVQVTARVRDDLASFHMYGRIIEIISISRL